MEREWAQQRTHDALLRRARGGYVTGGKVYGYDHVRASTPGPTGGIHRPPARRVINPAQAAVVRRIFEGSAEGWGITRIAKQLNAERISPPRGGAHGWAPTAIREILYNELYRGRLLWNRTRKAHRRGTKTQETRPPADLFRPRDELLAVAAPVDDDHRRGRPSGPHRVLEAVAAYSPLACAAGDVARARGNAPAVFVVPDG